MMNQLAMSTNRNPIPQRKRIRDTHDPLITIRRKITKRRQSTTTSTHRTAHGTVPTRSIIGPPDLITSGRDRTEEDGDNHLLAGEIIMGASRRKQRYDTTQRKITSG